MVSDYIATNSQKDVKKWKKIALILLIILICVGVGFYLDTFYHIAYDKGVKDGETQGFLLAIQDICQDDAITIQNNMTTKIIPMEDVC